MLPNKYINYVDATTKEIVGTDYFCDPELQWGKTKDGNITLFGLFEGHPTEEWLKNNPRPKG